MLSTLSTVHDFPGWHLVLPLAFTALGTCLLVAGMYSVVVPLPVFGVDILCPPAFGSLQLDIRAAQGPPTGNTCFCQPMARARQGNGESRECFWCGDFYYTKVNPWASSKLKVLPVVVAKNRAGGKTEGWGGQLSMTIMTLEEEPCAPLCTKFVGGFCHGHGQVWVCVRRGFSGQSLLLHNP